MGRLIALMAIVGLACAWVASFAGYGYDAANRPHLLQDGQYAFTFLGTMPIGWLIGSIGTVLAAARRNASSLTNTQVTLLIAGAVVMTPVMTLQFVGVVAGTIGLVVQLFRPG